ncbi:hypothetical protein ABTA54_19470, partial [Acinetobacter baumannii]
MIVPRRSGKAEIKTVLHLDGRTETINQDAISVMIEIQRETVRPVTREDGHFHVVKTASDRLQGGRIAIEMTADLPAMGIHKDRSRIDR